MSFSQGTITGVKVQRRTGQAFISWTSTSPTGTFFQVYKNGQLADFTTKRNAWIPAPTGLERFAVGTVATGDERTAFTDALPAIPLDKATLAWKGGTFESPDIAGFYVYGSDVADGPVDYTSQLADITAYPGGIVTDGYGLGEYGFGGWGESDSNYSWESGVLENGVWTFAVVPYDSAGNSGTAATAQVVINGPPLPSPPFPDGVFIHYTYDPQTQIAVLMWEPSPSA
jgi:hypothetical protein